MDLLYALLAALAISLIALVGILFLPKNWTHRREVVFVGFAAGVLLATSALQLLPEAIEEGGGEIGLFYALLGGIVAFFYLERLLHGFHGHSHESHRRDESARYLILTGDGLHNFIDGVAIGGAFLVDPALGIATTIAVAAHELPQEIADFAVLVRGGFSRKKALLLNLASGAMALLGVLLVFALQETVEPYIGYLLAVTAGMFIYIAAADLIPELHHDHQENEQFGFPFLLGIVLVMLITVYAPSHAHEEGHESEEHANRLSQEV
jgi:zinc and cadmium transporter